MQENGLHGYAMNAKMKSKIFYSADCNCGWHYGPSNKGMLKLMVRVHKEIHKMEGS